MHLFRGPFRVFLIHRRWWSAAACLCLATAIFYVINYPAVIGAASTTRQLPIYCVQRDQKLVSISFDAAGVMSECGNPVNQTGLPHSFVFVSFHN